ncbi:MAG TPA: SprT family zinc-dependent metalloprotease [Candidatus Saccharimonadia bacterium]|nr:SprT family zinc-dependent metalloprotease [Candidatus Saccharimonadia bacterium]
MIKTASPNGIHVIEFGGETIPFGLEMRQRRRLSISVHPDRRVTVLAPADCSLADVLAGVQKRAAWITRQRAYFEQFHPLPHEKRYVSGETHLYLGRQYRLKIQSAATASVKLMGSYLHVATANCHDAIQVQQLLDDWYRNHAKGIFQTRLLQCLDAAPSLCMPTPVIIVRRMSRRWGSCTKAGHILLNLDLVKTPLYCIEYVIMHELCHLRIHNHSPSYYRLLSRCMPDWEKRKTRLNSYVI